MQATREYALGDVVTTLIQTEAGQTIVLKHDTDSPRPYSRNICVQGTAGIVRNNPEEKIHIEGRSPAHEWESLSNYEAEFEHPLWRNVSDMATGIGHGGMDFIEDFRLVHCLGTGTPPDMDVFDAAAWSAVCALSEQSIADGCQPVEFPDFTRGKWKTREPLGVVS